MRRQQWTVLTFSPLNANTGGPAVRTVGFLRFLECQPRIDVCVVLVGPSAGSVSGRWRTLSTAGKPFLINALFGHLRFVWRLLSSDVVMIGSPLFVLAAVLAKLGGAAVLWDAKSCEWEFFYRSWSQSGSISSLLRMLVWAALEYSSGRLADVAICTSEEDRATFGLFSRVKPKLQPLPLTTLDLPRGSLASDLLEVKYVFFLGTVRGANNRASVEHLIRNRLFLDGLFSRGIRLVLAGSSTEEYAGVHPSVVALGQIENPRPLIENSLACLAPLDNHYGVSAKVIDYLKYGRRIIATRPALTGLLFETANCVWITPYRDFARRVLAIIQEPIHEAEVTAMNDNARRLYGEEALSRNFAVLLQRAFPVHFH